MDKSHVRFSSLPDLYKTFDATDLSRPVSVVQSGSGTVVAAQDYMLLIDCR